MNISPSRFGVSSSAPTNCFGVGGRFVSQFLPIVLVILGFALARPLRADDPPAEEAKPAETQPTNAQPADSPQANHPAGEAAPKPAGEEAKPAGEEAKSGGQETIHLERPGQREFVRDLAHMLSDEDQARIKEIAGKLLDERQIPIIVVTIDSMADHTPFRLRIETFAHLLYDQWGIGSPKLNGQDWNKGILLLVSKKDRKARIELGGGWRREKDHECQRIMTDRIIPRFKQGQFSSGIVVGVEQLDRMARGSTAAADVPAPADGKLPTLPGPKNLPPVAPARPQHVQAPPEAIPPLQFPQHNTTFRRQQPGFGAGGLGLACVLAFIVVAVLAVFSVLRAISSAIRGVTGGASGRRRRRPGFGDGFMWGNMFGWPAGGLYDQSRHNYQHDTWNSTPTSFGHSAGPSFDAGSSGGGGSSGGSFDSGSSGGGGASGSW